MVVVVVVEEVEEEVVGVEEGGVLEHNKLANKLVRKPRVDTQGHNLEDFSCVCGNALKNKVYHGNSLLSDSSNTNLSMCTDYVSRGRCPI